MKKALISCKGKRKVFIPHDVTIYKDRSGIERRLG